MVNSEELTEGINKRVEVAEVKRIAMRGGMKTLHQDSMLKVRSGVTTIEEVLASVPPDMIATQFAVRPIANYA
jgi:type IV pilus assembly protein PilB